MGYDTEKAQQWFSTREAAAYIRFSPRTLASWREDGKGPKYVKVAGRCRYPRSGLDRHMEENDVRREQSPDEGRT